MSTGHAESSEGPSPAGGTYRLVADIGGTHARFALAKAGSHDCEDEHEFPTSSFPGVEEAIRHYLDLTKGKAPSEAALAIANPVTGDKVHMTNNSWAFSIAQLKAALGLQRLLVINDFEALALSIPHLPESSFRKIGGGASEAHAPIALIGPGTGLGMAGLIHAAGDWIPLVSEGGHITAPVAGAREAAVVAVLAERFDRVSAERVVSGPGLVNLYQSLAAVDGRLPEDLSAKDISDAALADLPATEGTQAAQDRRSHAREALEMFCQMLGTLAGDLALVLGARGGVYLGGGILPSIGDYLLNSGFRKRFEDKGRMAPLLQGIPTFIIEAPHAAFLGDLIALERPDQHTL